METKQWMQREKGGGERKRRWKKRGRRRCGSVQRFGLASTPSLAAAVIIIIIIKYRRLKLWVGQFSPLFGLVS